MIIIVELITISIFGIVTFFFFWWCDHLKSTVLANFQYLVQYYQLQPSGLTLDYQVYSSYITITLYPLTSICPFLLPLKISFTLQTKLSFSRFASVPTTLCCVPNTEVDYQSPFILVLVLLFYLFCIFGNAKTKSGIHTVFIKKERRCRPKRIEGFKRNAGLI